MRAASPVRRGAANRLTNIDRLLAATYGTPESELENKPDPLDEAIYMILSFQTDLARLKARRGLDCARRIPHGTRVERAPPATSRAYFVTGASTGRKRARIRRLLASIREVAGELSLDLLRTMNDEDAEQLAHPPPGSVVEGGPLRPSLQPRARRAANRQQHVSHLEADRCSLAASRLSTPHAARCNPGRRAPHSPTCTACEPRRARAAHVPCHVIRAVHPLPDRVPIARRSASLPLRVRRCGRSS